MISVEGLPFKVPRGWCPVGSGNGVSLVSVPLSSSDKSIVILLGALPRDLVECLPKLPERTEIRGKSVLLAGDASRHDLSGLTAFRMQYRESNNAIPESFVAWLLPGYDLMISSWAVPPSKLGFFDDIVALLIDEADLKPRVEGETDKVGERSVSNCNTTSNSGDPLSLPTTR